MALVIPFYMLFAKGFRASYSFFRKRMGYWPLKSFFHVYKNEFEFGKVVLDPQVAGVLVQYFSTADPRLGTRRIRLSAKAVRSGTSSSQKASRSALRANPCPSGFP